MRVSIRWLKKIISLDVPIHDIIDTLTMAGIEVEDTFDLGMGSGKIVIGRILEIKSHPDADKLVLCKVETGGEPGAVNIVCGATNIKEGDVVPLALHGAVLPSGIKIKRTAIRGQASEGMMCSAKELGLGDDHSGILILPSDMPLGEPFDFIIDVSITPNRPDCLSYFGVARELAAQFGKTIHMPSPRFVEAMKNIETRVNISLKARGDCSRYAARCVTNIKVGESPAWMQYVLVASGLRPINNIVDITNYVLLMLGHPIHAFDIDKVHEGQVVVRNAVDGERITLLDGREVALKEEDLLIADPEKPLALAGIMGGENSGITDDTSNILIESAYFTPATIMKTAKRLGLQTDASYRFERGTDRQGLIAALNLVTQLVKEFAGGDVLKNHIDVQTTASAPAPLVLSISKTNRYLGLNLKSREVADCLSRLGFEIRGSEKDALMVAIPSHRVDVSRDVDLIEEVARIHGYNNIPTTAPMVQAKPASDPPEIRVEKRLREALVALGFNETLTMSFAGMADFQALGIEPADPVTLLNPIAADQNMMRTSLLPGLLSSFRFNMNRGITDLKLFEIGMSYHKNENSFYEIPWLLAGASGVSDASWRNKGEKADFFFIKGVAEDLMRAVNIHRYQLEPVKDCPWLHPGKAAALKAGGTELCRFGEFHPALLEQCDLKKGMALLELRIPDLAGHFKEDIRFRAISRHPAVVRDLAVVVDRDMSAAAVQHAIMDAVPDHLEHIEIFDVYTGDQVAEGKRSLAFSLRFRASDRSLTDEEVQRYHDKILEALTEKCGAELR